MNIQPSTDPFQNLELTMKEIETESKKSLGETGLKSDLSRAWTNLTGKPEDKLKIHFQDMQRKALEGSVTYLVSKLEGIEDKIKMQLLAAETNEAVIPTLEMIDQDPSNNIAQLLSEINQLEKTKMSWTKTKSDLTKIENALKDTPIEKKTTLLLQGEIAKMDKLIASIPNRDKTQWDKKSS